MSEEIYHEMRRLGKEYAKAKGDRIYLSEFRKSKKAILMKEAEASDSSMAANKQERDAYAHPEYIELLKGLQAATEIEAEKKNELDIIERQFEAWRAKEATRRAEMNLR